MNKIVLIGNLTADPELRTTPNGISVCNFDIAVNNRGRRAQSADAPHADALFFHITVWRTLAENCKKYLTKGRKIFVSGPLSYHTYAANDGSTRFVLDVTAEDIEFLSSMAAGTDSTSNETAADPSGFTPVEMEPDELPF